MKEYHPMPTNFCHFFSLLALIATSFLPLHAYSQVNENKNTQQGNSDATLALEIPRLNPDNIFVAHYAQTGEGTILNYSLEWNATMRHSQWVAYSIDRKTLLKVVDRCDCYDVDPLLPSSMRIDNTYHKRDGFDRGHLCRSADRLNSKEANRQTFYFSNISPQIQSFNSKIWQKLEDELKNWGELIKSGKYDRLYVVKGGTLDKRLLDFRGAKKHSDGTYPTTDSNGFTIHGLACPAYYFMAVLAEREGKYSAIAFYVPHAEATQKKYTAADIKACAISVEELERLTGIDFFCNLPDDVEEEVETTLNLAGWKW